MMQGALIVFLKAPKAGRVKTRLGREIGFGRAASIFRALTTLTLDEARRGDWKKVIAVDPRGALFGWRALWPSSFERMEQAPGDLGARMKAAFNAVAKGPVVIIGADAPGMRAAHLRTAFKALGRADAVFGPALDGGYWLIGLARRKPAPNLFDAVRWSSRHALEDTLASLPRGFKVEYLPLLRDLDDAGDLAALSPFLRSKR